MKMPNSRELYAQATSVMVGGVNSPVRAFKAVGGTPLFIVRGRGSRIWDADGNSFIDFVGSWGPLIIGHSNPKVMKAVTRAAMTGTSFGAPSVPELRLAQKVCDMMPSIQKVRFVSSGTEATMSALRLARAFSGRTKLLKFEGCYHGHADPFLTRAGSGMATFDMPASAGVTPSAGAETLTVEFNNEEQLEEAFRSHGGEIAACIIEPVAGNMGVVPPMPGYLQRLRKLCNESGSVLIFDEVITGFRVAPGGAQEVYGVTPDLTCLGKIIGGGFPVGAYGGRHDIMRMVAPEGQVYQAGTLSGNPVAMAGGLSTLNQLNRKAYSKLERLSASLEEGLLEGAAAGGVEVTLNRVGSMLSLYFASGRIRSFREAKGSNHRLYPRFHRKLLESGIYLPPSAFETFFVSTAHTDGDLKTTVSASRRAFRGLAS
jgi:glutamate-1-semialdehyde 2,1-aminomutase